MKKIEREIQALRKFSKLPMQATLAGMIVASPFAFGADTEQKAQGETVLAPVEVTGAKQGGTAAPIRSYNKQVTTIGRVPTAQRDIPQTVTVVTSKLIEDQHATSMKEALRNVAGLTFNAGEGGRTGDNVTIRGFSAATDLYLDGVRDIGQYNRDLFNTEQVDILKGPSSMLFGRGSTGGVVNQVSKTPYAGQERDLSVSVGSYDNYRVEADLNEQLNATTAARINIMGQKADSFRDYVENNRWGVAPSMVFGLGQPTELTLAWLHMEENNVPDFGVPYQNGKPMSLPKERFYGLADHDYEKNNTDIGTATLQHKFSKEWKVRNILRHGVYDRDLAPTAPRYNTSSATNGCNTSVTGVSAPCITRGRPIRVAEDEILSNQLDLIGNFQTGTVQHQVLAGVELGKEKSHSERFANAGVSLQTSVDNPNNFPDMSNAVQSPVQDVRFDAETIGIYMQDLFLLTDNWKILLGLRWDRFKGDYFRMQYSGNDAGPHAHQRTDSMWNYRTGVIYQPTDIASYYVSLGTSFNPSGEAYALDSNTDHLAPEKNKNIEAGAKLDFFNGDLSVRTSIFRAIKTNERNTDLLNSEVSALSGERHTDGIELEVAGRITPDWEVFTGMTYLDAKVDKAAPGSRQENTAGKRPMNTPNYTANLWTTYRIAPAWRIGGGVNAVGQRYANADNSNQLPSYAVWDAMASYEQEQYDVQLNFYNLFDKKYYEGQYPGHATYGKARTAMVTLNYHF